MNATPEKGVMALALEEAHAQPWAWEGYDKKLGGWPVPSTADPHTHYRDPVTQPNLFRLSVAHSALLYDFSTAMPNLGKNRIRLPSQAFEYANRLREEGRKINPVFDVTVPLYLEPDTDPEVVRSGFEQGAWRTMKLYPKAGTTGSDFGVDFNEIDQVFPVFEVTEKLGMLALIHSEVVRDRDTGKLIPDRHREPEAIYTIEEILAEYPRQKIGVEHISKLEMIHAVHNWRHKGYQVHATVAPQYLVWNSTILTQAGMNPDFYSIPILGDEEDREENERFYANDEAIAGTDSAIHAHAAKSQSRGCPGGVFNAPVSLHTYFHVMRVHGGHDWFRKFLNTTCFRAREVYGLPRPSDTPIRLITEKAWEVPEFYQDGDVSVAPMFAGMTMPYSVRML